MRIVNKWFVSIVGLTCLAGILVIVLTLWSSSWDLNSLIRVGTRYSEGDIHGSEGYDGQFNLFIALDPKPDRVRTKLDVPAYRYQRIILPLLARSVAFGDPKIIPWAIILLPLLGQLMGTIFVYLIMKFYNVPTIYTLVYGLGAGFLLSIRLALPEPIAFGLVAGALYFYLLKKYPLSYIFMACAFFTKEVTVIFGGALFLSLLANRKINQSLLLFLIAFLPFGLFQIWLYCTFGEFGMGSGGAMATSFEVIPFMGLIRIAKYSLVYFLAMVLTFFPLVILPSVWGVFVSIKEMLQKNWDPIGIALLLNSVVMFFLPFSTYRETGGILRFSCGLTLAVLLFSAKFRMEKIIKYTPFWIVYNVFLFKGI